MKKKIEEPTITHLVKDGRVYSPSQWKRAFPFRATPEFIYLKTENGEEIKVTITPPKGGKDEIGQI